METKFTTSLHTHVRSIFDAYISPKELCERILEMGGKGCAITDHGVLSSIEDYRGAFQNSGLKLIPGCEVYVDGGILGRQHLVVLAVDDKGYQGICKIVTKSNENLEGEDKKSMFPVIKQEELFAIAKKYRGHIIALSACMQGVIATIFLLNSKVERKIEKIRKKQAKYMSADSEEYRLLLRKKEAIDKKVSDAIIYRDNVKRVAEEKFSKREKAIRAAQKAGQDTFHAEMELAADKRAQQKAVLDLPEAKAALDEVKKRQFAVNKELKDAEKSIQSFNEYEKEISELSKELKSEKELYQTAISEAKKYEDAFAKSYFFAEVQYHGIPEEKEVFPKVVKVARHIGLPIVATNDVHILRKDDKERLMRRLQKSLRFGDAFEEESVGDDELYLKNDSELAEALLKILPKDVVDEAIGNIERIFNKCNVTFEPGKHYPKFSQEEDADTLLDAEIEKGIKWRFPEGMDEEHKTRLEYEVGIIKSMGYSDYHLIVKDFLEYGRLLGYIPTEELDNVPLSIEGLKALIEEKGYKNPGMLTGPGRGSAVGSLACYLLGITSLDPLQYGLLFERFLNPERISMPDIDSDFANTIRGKVIDYVKSKYGEKAVCGIMTMTFQAPKGAIRIAAKYYGLKEKGVSLIGLGDTIAKSFPMEPGVSFKTKVDVNGKKDENGKQTLSEYLLKKFEGNEDAQGIIQWALMIEGLPTAYGSHAAGIVVSDNRDISDYLPLRYNSELGMMTTQCDMVQVEDNGLLKFDFLGLKTLDVITGTLRMIEKNHGIIYDILKIDLNDRKVYSEIFSKGKTNSVFQFESDGMKAMLKRFKPETFEDLIILVSMFRPGPLQYLDDVIKVKNGKEEMKFLCPQLEPIVGKTYGAIVYQEQVMEICQKLAGYTLGGADTVRRYMSKKKADKLAHEEKKFVEGCLNNGISEEIANTLFKQMMDFASYAFNKSHAAAYAYNAYVTAWLKYYYPAEFFANALNWANKTEKIAGLMTEAANSGVKVLAPNINLSEEDVTVINGNIVFGLSKVKGVSNHAISIVTTRKAGGAYKSIEDFILRVNPNIAVITNLVGAGAFDDFHSNRLAMIKYIEETKTLMSKLLQKKSLLESLEFCLPYAENTDLETLKVMQAEKGLTVAVKEKTTAAKISTKIENAKQAIEKLENEIGLTRFHNLPENKLERMNIERSFLGMYVTKHPMEYYPEPGEVGCKTIEDSVVSLSEEPITAIYGVITDLEIKKRKKDGASMAFFSLEDKTRQINCYCFTRQYQKNAKLLEDGKVVKLIGNLNTQETDDDETVYTFIVDEVRAVEEKAPALLMDVSSYASFHLDIEEEFKELYACEDGREFLIHDIALDEIREMNYKVSEKIMTFQNVIEL